MFELQGSRSDIIDDFDENHLDVLAEIVSDISDPELRARIGDVLWIRKREHNFAELAIEAYDRIR